MNSKNLRLATRISLLVMVSPIVLWAFGMVLNGLFGCDVRDDVGAVFGDCAEWQAETVYFLLMSPWFAMFTVPIFGGIALILFVARFIVWLKNRQKS